jgi:hypothetical protein
MIPIIMDRDKDGPMFSHGAVGEGGCNRSDATHTHKVQNNYNQYLKMNNFFRNSAIVNTYK